MNFTAYSLLVDFCIMSFLLFISQLLRSKIRFLQNFYIPSSLIAGFIGLFAGPQFLKIAPFSSQAGSYPYLLVCVLFAGLFLGKQEKIGFKKILGQIGDTFFINMAAEIMCFGLAILFGGLLVKFIFPAAFNEICILLPSGFAGGHGYAAAIGGTLNGLLNRDDCITIGQTFATLGLLTGLFGGIICINYATRKGATRFITTIGSLPEEYRTGMIPGEKRKSMGDETVHPMSIDPLAWHISLVLFAAGLGYGAYQLYKPHFPNIEVPMMCLTMLAGVLIQTVMNKIGYGKYVDKRIIDRIGRCVTDYLVCFGVATIRISVVLQFIGPIAVLCVIGIVWPLILVFFVGRRLFRNFFFERSIFIFGWITGVVAIGVTLLRVVDPEMKSGTLDDFGTAYTLQSIVELFLVMFSPVFLVQAGFLPVGSILTVTALGMFVLCGICFGVNKDPMNVLRPGEAGIINKKETL
jgi:ESS family glutamate:Na+ symporter